LNFKLFLKVLGVGSWVLGKKKSSVSAPDFFPNLKPKNATKYKTLPRIFVILL
jgi:hypothetical protein